MGGPLERGLGPVGAGGGVRAQDSGRDRAEQGLAGGQGDDVEVSSCGVGLVARSCGGGGVRRPGRLRSERRIKAAPLPRDRSPRAFDFDANPNIDPVTVNTLATSSGPRRVSHSASSVTPAPASRTC
ncbi:hypothetical protein GCM10010236_30670 [Streptomyces eurythermus]|nr:hypothetical protein GCM10010236_30670 [Streptomyces eurythermus]